MSGLSPSGFIKPTLPQIKSELEQRFRDQFSDNIDLSPSGFIGQLIGILSEREFLIWEGQESVYFSRYWNTATGNSLDEAAQLVGQERREAQFSTGVVVFVGETGRVIPFGFEIFVPGNTSQRWLVASEVTIQAGTANANVIADSPGERIALAGTVTGIVSNINGVDSVSNPADFFIGRNRETDSEFRIRIRDNLQLPGTSTGEGIRSSILRLDNAIACSVIENTTDTVDGDGRPPHSFETFVFDDNLEPDENIGQAILDSKPAGIQTAGVTSVLVQDSQGVQYEIRFTRPTEIPIYIDVTVTTNADLLEGSVYPVNGDDLVLEAILAYGRTRRNPSLDIIRVGIVQFIMRDVPGIVDLDIKLGKTPTPTLSDNIAIEIDEISNFDEMNIGVTSV